MPLNAFTACAVQFEPTLFDKRRNVTALLTLVRQAADGGADLIVLPEMATTGYCLFDETEAATVAEAIPGTTTNQFEALASELSVHVVVGMPELDPETGLLYNSAALIGPDGLVGVHRKTHGYIAEPKWAAPGNHGHAVFDTPLGRIGLLICMDIHFIETARVQALADADVICHISAWLAERTPAPYWISRALENSVYLVEANRWGLERGVQFSGGSCIIDPDGKILASRDTGDGLVFATVDPVHRKARQAAADSPFQRRRAELYRSLQRDSYLWNPLDFFGLYSHEPLPLGRRSNVAVAQTAPTSDRGTNVRDILGHADLLVRENNVDLVVFPELSLTGPTPEGTAVAGIRLDSDGLAELLDFCAATSTHLVVGIAEQDSQTDELHNTVVLLGPEGIVARHRKLHLGEHDSGFAPGSCWTVADTPIGRIGLLTGDDLLQPESARVLALRGCDLIVVPARLTRTFVSSHEGTAVPLEYPIPTGSSRTHWHHARVRAGENNVYLAYANFSTPDHGQSGIFGPDTFQFPRDERTLSAGPGVTWMPITTESAAGSAYPTNVVRRKDLVSMRLPHHYHSLSTRDR